MEMLTATVDLSTILGPYTRDRSTITWQMALASSKTNDWDMYIKANGLTICPMVVAKSCGRTGACTLAT
jgi:hypothetical protein